MRAAMVATVVMALALTGCGRDRYESSYPDMIAARQQDAVARGWIPGFLPEEATDLREAHLPESGEAVVRATLAGGILPDACVEVDEVGATTLEASWLPGGTGAVGTPVRCDDWEGRLDGTTLVVWTQVEDPKDDE